MVGTPWFACDVSCGTTFAFTFGNSRGRPYTIQVDAISASADNKMAFLTRQRRSTLKKRIDRVSSNTGVGRGAFGVLFSITWNLIILLVIGYLIFIFYQVCVPELSNLSDLENAAKCVWNTVLVASPERPAISHVPFWNMIRFGSFTRTTWHLSCPFLKHDFYTFINN